MTWRGPVCQEAETPRRETDVTSAALGDKIFSLAAFSEDISETTAATRVQDTVGLWLAQGRDLTLPLHHYEELEAQANNVNPRAKQEKPRGLRNFFTSLAKLLGSTAVADSGATGNFNKKGVGEPTGEASRKVVGMPNGQVERATKQTLLPLPQLTKEARKSDEIPSLQNNLVSVPVLADNGYTTIFKPSNEGVEVYKSGDVQIVPKREPVLRGWRGPTRLWHFPLDEKGVPNLAEWRVSTVLPEAQANHLHHLPSVEARVAYIHACLGFPTKAAMLSAAAAGRLIGIPFATVANIRRFYPETKETPKGHLDQQ